VAERLGAEVARVGVGNTGVGMLLIVGEEAGEEEAGTVEGCAAWTGASSSTEGVAVGFVGCWVMPKKKKIRIIHKNSK
jgi:hypothetical protein